MPDLVRERAWSSLCKALRNVSGAEHGRRPVQNGDFLIVRFQHAAIANNTNGKVRPCMVVNAGNTNGQSWVDGMMVTTSFGSPWMSGLDVFELHGQTVLPQKNLPPEGWELRTGFQRLTPAFVTRFPVSRKHFPDGMRVINVLPEFHRAVMARDCVVAEPDMTVFDDFIAKRQPGEPVLGRDAA